MRSLAFAAVAVACGSLLLTPSARAEHYRHHSTAPSSNNFRDYGSRPYWQGEPLDRLPIWRNGYYQGNDPDQFIRGQLMRDPPNLPGSSK